MSEFASVVMMTAVSSGAYPLVQRSVSPAKVKGSSLFKRIKGVLASVDHDQRHGHPKQPDRMFVAHDVVELAVDRMPDKHGPTDSLFRRREEVRRPLVQ